MIHDNETTNRIANETRDEEVSLYGLRQAWELKIVLVNLAQESRHKILLTRLDDCDDFFLTLLLYGGYGMELVKRRSFWKCPYFQKKNAQNRNTLNTRKG